MNMEPYGGDCTNFVSACLYNGDIPMESSGTYKWYYYSPSNRSTSWSKVSDLRTYLLNNNTSSTSGNHGVYANTSSLYYLTNGDVVQNGTSHSMFISYARLVTGIVYEGHLICQRSTGEAGRLKNYPLAAKNLTDPRYYKINGYYA